MMYRSYEFTVFYYRIIYSAGSGEDSVTNEEENEGTVETKKEELCWQKTYLMGQCIPSIFHMCISVLKYCVVYVFFLYILC